MFNGRTPQLFCPRKSGGPVKLVVLGTDEGGQSKIVRVKEIHADDASAPMDILRQGLWSTREFPPEVPVPLRAPSEAPTTFKGDDRTSGFLVARFPPNLRTPNHRTDTLDYEVIIAGKIALHADEGSVELGVGDMMVIPGIRHFWVTEEDSCTMAVTWLSLSGSVAGAV
jgi:hypothetical protein